MQRKELFDYIKNTYNVEYDNPFTDDYDTCVFRHRDNKKWFALLMSVTKNKIIGLSGEETVDVLNVKCDSDFITSFYNGKSVFPAYHMNRKHWLSILLGCVEKDVLSMLLDISFNLTENKNGSKNKR